MVEKLILFVQNETPPPSQSLRRSGADLAEIEKENLYKIPLNEQNGKILSEIISKSNLFQTFTETSDAPVQINLSLLLAIESFITQVFTYCIAANLLFGERIKFLKNTMSSGVSYFVEINL